MKIRKGDIVIIISGNDKGITGRIIKVFLNKDRILNEEDKILLNKLYLKIKDEFKEIE